MNLCHAAHFDKLSADQDNAEAQFKYGHMIHHGDGMMVNRSVAAQYLRYEINMKEKMTEFARKSA
jgi:TPR repeat protein